MKKSIVFLSILLIALSSCKKKKVIAPAGLPPVVIVPVTPPVSGAGYKVIWGMSAQSISWVKWKENEFAIAASRNQPTPFVPLRHSYDSDFPATWAASAAAAEAGYGIKVSLLNVKCDWAQLASGAMDTKIIAFINSIPNGVKIMLSINHEPENDKGGNPTLAERDLWAKGQAQASRVVYANATRTRCEYVSCLMGYTFQDGSGRNPSDWNPGKYMTAAEKANHIFGVDVYFTMPKTGAGPTCDARAGGYITDAHTFGFTRLGILETGLDNSNGNTDEACAAWMKNVLGAYVADPAKGIEFVAWFNSTTNAAPFDPMIDSTPERQAFADLIINNR